MKPDRIPAGFRLARELAPHEAEILAIAWSPDGALIASASVDETIRLHDVETGELVRTLRGHAGPVSALAWSDGGALLYSGGRDGTLRLWRTATGDAAADGPLATHKDVEVKTIALAPSGERIAVAFSNGVVRLWSRPPERGTIGRDYFRLEGHSPTVQALAFSSDSESLAAAGEDGLVRYWDAANGRLADEVECIEGGVLSVATTPAGRIVAGHRSGAIQVWQRLYFPDWTRSLRGHEQGVTALAFSPDETLLASRSSDGTIRLWRCDRWEEATAPLPESTSSEETAGLAFHPRADVLATLGGHDRVVRLWALDRALLLAPPAPPVVAPPEAPEFDVFLCHHSADRDAVKAIGRVLRERGIRPWLAEWEIRPGVSWQRALEQRIRTIPSAAVFVGPSGFGPWQLLEEEAFIRHFVQRGCPVIPVILGECRAVPELPLLLEGMQWVDFRESDPDPMKQLVWGITNRREAD